MAGKAEYKIEMTRAGYDKLRAELVMLRSEKRSEIADKLEIARGFGDLSENAEYHAAKEEQEKIENRIRELEYQLGKAKVIENEDVDISVVNLGAVVQLQDLDTKDIFEYTIVGTAEADYKNKKISAVSPIGAAVMGNKKGTKVIVRTPRGIRKMKIKDIKMDDVDKAKNLA